MQPVERQRQPAGRGLGGVPGEPGDHQHRRRGEQRAGDRDQARRPSAASRSGRSTHSAIQAATQNSAKHSSRVDDRAAERGHPEQRHQRADVEHRAQRVVGGGEVQVHGDRDQPDDRGDHQRHRDRSQARVSGTRRASGRAISSRNTNSPIALITDRNIIHRVISSCGVAAVADDARDRELRRRAGVRADRVGEGSLDGMAVDRDRPPVDQVPALGQVAGAAARPACRDCGRALRRAGRLLVGLGVGDRDDREPRLDRLVVGELRRWGADRRARRWRPGTVLIRYACAEAALGSTSPAATAASAIERSARRRSHASGLPPAPPPPRR